SAFTQLVFIAEKEREFRFRVTMNGGEQHVVTRVENRLGAVPVVVVHVKNRHLLVALVEESLSRDRCVVQVAIAAHDIAGSVVSRRTAQSESAAGAVLNRSLSGEGDLGRA